MYTKFLTPTLLGYKNSLFAFVTQRNSACLYGKETVVIIFMVMIFLIITFSKTVRMDKKRE